MPRCTTGKRVTAASVDATDQEDEKVAIASVTISQDGDDVECRGESSVSCVKMTLASFCKNERLRRRIDKLVISANRLLGEAYVFANFHVVRLLSEHASELPAKNPLPKMDRNFFYRCILAVSINDARDSTLGEEFVHSIQQFDSLRRRESVNSKVSIRGWVQLVADLSIIMATMASNHLWVNLPKRIAQFIRIAHPNMRKHIKVILAAVLENPTASLEKVVSNPMARSVATELRTWLPLPSGQQFPSRAHLTLPFYYKMLSGIEARSRQIDATPQDKKSVKSQKLFSLLPRKNGFTLSYIPISSMCLVTLLKTCGLEAIKGDGRCVDRSALWAKYFNLNSIETHERKFNCRIVTDGYGVSALLNRTQRYTVALESDSVDSDCRVALSEDSVCVRSVDPGYTDVVTVVDEEGHSVAYSSAQYYHDAKIRYSMRRTRRWCEETRCLSDHIQHGMTASMPEMLSHVASYLQVLPTLLRHRASRRFRALRFLRFVERQKAIHNICDIIAPRTAMTVVLFGDWKGASNSPVSRKTCGPLQDVRRCLKQRPNVIVREVDEFRTSKRCSCCHNTLTNMRYTTSEGQAKRVHKVLHCKTSDKRLAGPRPTKPCNTTWNRDANAARNILMLGLLEIAGFERPAAFQRAASRKTLISAKQRLTLRPQILHGNAVVVRRLAAILRTLQSCITLTQHDCGSAPAHHPHHPGQVHQDTINGFLEGGISRPAVA